MKTEETESSCIKCNEIFLKSSFNILLKKFLLKIKMIPTRNISSKKNPLIYHKINSDLRWVFNVLTLHYYNFGLHSSAAL